MSVGFAAKRHIPLVKLRGFIVICWQAFCSCQMAIIPSKYWIANHYMSAITIPSKKLLNFISAPGLTDDQSKKRWQAEGMAYVLAIFIHLALWQVYKAMPTHVPEPEPLIIEATLVVQPAPAAAAPAAPAPPQPEFKPPPPAPKPVPKVEKPIPKKVEKPKPEPKPKPAPKPVARPLPKPMPESKPEEETDTSPAPAAHEPAYEAPSAPVEAPTRAAPKAPPAPVENTEYHPGHIGGFGRNNYPSAAKERGWEGTVKLKVHIQADGDIGEVIVLESSGHDMLDEAAVDMIKEGHATPARRGDKPVDSWVILPYRFRLGHE